MKTTARSCVRCFHVACTVPVRSGTRQLPAFYAADTCLREEVVLGIFWIRCSEGEGWKEGWEGGKDEGKEASQKQHHHVTLEANRIGGMKAIVGKPQNHLLIMMRDYLPSPTPAISIKGARTDFWMHVLYNRIIARKCG